MGIDPTTLRVRSGETAPAFDLIEAGVPHPTSVDEWMASLPDDPMQRLHAVSVMPSLSLEVRP